ncbi:MAG: hypothetical protein ACLTXI_09185 [Collinsella sp.]
MVVDIKLDAKEAKGGARKTVRYTRFDTCGHCGGSALFRPSMHIPVRAAAVAATSMSTCPFCLVPARSSLSALSAVAPVRSSPTPVPIAAAAGEPV